MLSCQNRTPNLQAYTNFWYDTLILWYKMLNPDIEQAGILC